MASTKDLFDKLKKDPLVDISMDYDTFNERLNDPTFLTNIEDVLSDSGDDITTYGISKKKKDSEVESFQPTEQPSAATEATDTVGVDQSQIDSEADLDPLNADLSAYKMDVKTPEFANQNTSIETAPQPQDMGQEVVMEKSVTTPVTATQSKYDTILNLAKNVKNKFVSKHIDPIFSQAKQATAQFEQEIKPEEEVSGEIESGGPGDPKKQTVKSAASSMYNEMDSLNYKQALRVLGNTKVLGVKMDGNNYEVVFTNSKMGGEDQGRTYKGVIGDPTWEGYVSNATESSDLYDDATAWEDLKSAVITKDTYSPEIEGKPLQPSFNNNLSAHKSKYFPQGSVGQITKTVSIPSEEKKEGREVPFGTDVKRLLEKANIKIKTSNIINKDKEENKEYNIAKETIPQTEYVLDTEQSFYSSLNNSPETNSVMQANAFSFNDVLLPSSKNRENVLGAIKSNLVASGADPATVDQQAGVIYKEMLRDARYHAAEQYIRHEIESGNKTFKQQDIDRLQQAKQNRVDESKGVESLAMQSDKNFVSNLWDVSLSDYVNYYDAKATVYSRNMDIKNIPGKISAYTNRMNELQAQIEAEKNKLQIPSKEQLSQTAKGLKGIREKVDAYDSQLTQVQNEANSLLVEQDGKKYLKDEASRARYEELAAQSNQILNERNALVEQSKAGSQDIEKVDKFQKNISRQLKEYEALRKKLNYYDDDSDLLGMKGLSSTLTSIQDYEADRSAGVKNDLYDFEDYRKKTKEDEEASKKEAENDNVLEAAGKGITGGLANMFIGVAKTGMYASDAIFESEEDQKVWTSGDELLAATSQLQENISKWAFNPNYDKWGLNWFVNGSAGVVPDLAAIYMTGGGAGITELAAQKGLVKAVGTIATSPTTAYFTLRSTGDYAEKLQKAGYSPGEAFLGGGIIAGTEAMLESLLPTFFSSTERISVKSLWKEIIETGIAKKLPAEVIALQLKEGTKGIAKNYGKSLVVNTVNESAEEGTQTLFTESAFAAATDETIQIFDPQTGGMGKTLEAVTESTAIGGAIGGVGSGVTGIRTIMNERANNATLKLTQLQIGRKYDNIIKEADKLSKDFKGSEVEKEYDTINKEYKKLSANPNFVKYDDVAQAEVLDKALTLNELKEAQKNYKDQNIVDVKLDTQIVEKEKELAATINTAQENTDAREEMNKQLEEIGVQSFTLNANGDVNGITFDELTTPEEESDSINKAVEIIEKVYKPKPEVNAVQEPSTTEVLPSQPSEVRETGRKRQGVEPSVKGEEVAQEGGKKEIVPGAKDIVSEVSIQYPTEQEMQERKEFRSTPEYIQSTSDRIDDVNLDEVKADLEGDFGLLTAENPMAQPLTEEENAQLNQKAEQWLTDKGYSFKKVTGKYGQGENSFLVPKLTKEDALAFAKQFNQDSVAHSDGLIYQDGTMNPRVKEDDDFSFENEYNPDSDFVSVVKSNGSLKTFSVGYNFDVKENAFEGEVKAQEERKSTADKIRGLKSESGRAYSAALGIPIAIWDGAVELIATSIEAGESFVNAINKAKEYLKQQLGDDYNEDIAEEFMDEVINQSPLQLNNTDKVKGTPVKVNPDGHNLSFVKEEDLIDIDALIKDIEAKGETVWFWVADQLGRGYYMDSKTGEKHYLDAGPSYALDPKNREKNVIWASGVKEKTLNENIAKTDYIFIISGSPEKSKLFNKAVFQVFQEKIGDYNTFKKEVLANKPVKGIKEVLEAHDSWESLIEDASVNGKDGKIGTGRKKFLNELVDASKKPNSSLYKVLKDKDALVNVDDLRDGFYADNNFQQNDIMLVLKPEKLGGKSEHSTYENDLMGEVVGVPNKKINAYDILPDKLRGKDLKTSEQSQKIAPYGSGIKPVSASQNIARGLREAADLIRQGKRGGLAMNPIDPFLEVVAKALEAGASLTEAIAKGIEAFKNSDFYKNLTTQEKSKAVNDLKKAMDEQIAPTIANLINEEMLKGKGLYTASQNVKKAMINEGVIDEATFDRIVGKAEKIVKDEAEQMIVDATDKAVEDIRSGAGLDNALNTLSDFINNEVGFYKSQDKTIKKDLSDKAKANVMDQLASKIAGDAKSYMDVDNMSKADAIEKALGDATSAGMEFSTVDQLRDSVKNSLDKIKSKDAAEARKNEPTVTTTEKQIMKDKLKAMDAALKEAVAKAKQDKKDDKEMRQLVRNWVKEYLKTSGISAKISPVQMRAIVSRATGVVSDMTDTKMKALTDYVEKVVADQEYAQMINDLEKNKKGASKKRHNQYTEAVRRYLSLPLVNSDGTPLMNDQELKAYAESVARLNQSVPDHSRMDMNLADRVLNDYNQIPSKLEKSDFNDAYNDIKNSTIDDLEEYNEFVKKVNKAKRILDSLYNNGKVTEDEYNDALNELYTKENGLRVYEQQHQDQIDALKEGMIDDIVDMSNYVDKSGFIGQQNEVYRRLEVMLTKPEMLMSLDVKDLVKLTEVMDRMADGFVAEKELREIVNRAETRGQKKGESIVNQLASIYKSLNTPDLTKLRNLLKLTEPAQIERVLGLATGPIYNNIIQPINSAFTKMRKNNERLMDQYYQARQDNKFKGDVVVKRSEYDKGSVLKRGENIKVKADKYYSTRVAMLSSIFDYASKAMEQKAETKDFWGENLEKADVKKAYHNDGSLHIVKDIYSKLNNDPRFQTNGKLDYTKIYEAFLNDPKSVMSEAEYKLYEATQKINKEEIGEALVSANAIRGINGEISTVHYPRKSLGKSSSEDADLVAGTGGKVGGLRAGSSYSRVLETPKDAIDLNLDRVMATQIYEASRDLYLNDAIQQTNEVFRNAKENANPDEKAILQAIQNWNRKRVDFEMEKSAKNIITRSFAGFAPYALIGTVRTPAEFTTNLLAGMFNQISNVAKIGPKALTNPINPLQMKETKKIMEKFDSPVQFMSWSMKTYATYGKEKVDKNYFSSFYNSVVNMLMNISGPLTVGEWKSDFDAKFKELTGEKYNEAKHLDNDEYFYAMQEASSYANQQIERIKGGAFKGQGKQFVATLPIADIKKIFPGVKIKDEEGMLSANDTFAQMTNMFNNFVGRDVKNFITGAKQVGSRKDISGGFKDMIGSFYRLGSYYIIYNLLDAVKKSILGDDKEKELGEKKLEMFTTSEGRWETGYNTVLNFVTTVATSKYGANGRAIAVGALNYLYNSTDNQEQKDRAAEALKSMYFQDPIDTDKFGAAEKIIYTTAVMYIPTADVIADQLQREFETMAGSDKYKGATIADFFDQTGKFFNDPEVVDYKKFMLGAGTLATQLALVSGKSFPFMKDAIRFLKKDVQDKQNTIITNAQGENLVEGVLDFDADGNGRLSVNVDIKGATPEEKEKINEVLSNDATAIVNKYLNEKKKEIESESDDAMKFAWVQYYADKARYEAKAMAKLITTEEAPKEPKLGGLNDEERKNKIKQINQNYIDARANKKFSSSSKLSNSKTVQEGVQNLIENSEFKEAYNALKPSNRDDIAAIAAVKEYFLELYKYNQTPGLSAEPQAGDYFKNYNGKITPVE
jgi:hypothetical protein